jgi:hypothetical protein
MNSKHFRVVYGWDIRKDFATVDEAERFAAQMAAKPVVDPALRFVRVLGPRREVLAVTERPRT